MIEMVYDPNRECGINTCHEDGVSRVDVCHGFDVQTGNKKWKRFEHGRIISKINLCEKHLIIWSRATHDAFWGRPIETAQAPEEETCLDDQHKKIILEEIAELLEEDPLRITIYFKNRVKYFIGRNVPKIDSGGTAILIESGDTEYTDIIEEAKER